MNCRINGRHGNQNLLMVMFLESLYHWMQSIYFDLLKESKR